MVTIQQILNTFPAEGDIHRHESVKASVEVYKLVGITPALVYDEEGGKGIRYEYAVKVLAKSPKLTPDGLFAMQEAGWWRDGDKIVYRIG